jgi:flagellar basal body rod protein FlgG
MPDGITAAANALRYWEQRQAVVSNNLANASTDGFKAERVFARLVGESSPAADSVTDGRDGTMRETRNPLDLALRGDGFLVAQTPRGERFVRGGSLHIDAAGQLATADGAAILGEKGPITVAGGTVSIDHAGLVTVDGKVIDRLRMERVPPGTALQHDAGTMFVPDATRQSIALAERQLSQGFVEESNVNTIGSMVDMISIQRNYASAQKVITTLDGIRGTIANELGRLKT